MAVITEQMGENIGTGVFLIEAGGKNPGDGPYDGVLPIKVSIRSPANFANIEVASGVKITVKKSGGWTHATISGVYQGGEENGIFGWRAGERIAVISLVGHEAFYGGKEVGALVSGWPGRNKQRNSISPQGPWEGGDGTGSPWDPLNPAP